jgi:hypothetical protein
VQLIWFLFWHKCDNDPSSFLAELPDLQLCEAPPNRRTGFLFLHLQWFSKSNREWILGLCKHSPSLVFTHAAFANRQQGDFELFRIRRFGCRSSNTAVTARKNHISSRHTAGAGRDPHDDRLCRYSTKDSASVSSQIGCLKTELSLQPDHYHWRKSSLYDHDFTEKNLQWRKFTNVVACCRSSKAQSVAYEHDLCVQY